jgi:hypothetical protein
MKKFVIFSFLFLTVLNFCFSEFNISFKPAIGFLTQFNNQNIISAGAGLQIGADFNINNFIFNLSGEANISSGYPYGLEYHIGGFTEFNINNIGLGIGFFYYGNAFPMIKGEGYGSDYYNLQSLRFHIVLSNNIYKLMPYINMYFDFNKKHINNNIKIDSHQFGFGVIFSIALLKKKNNSLEIQYETIIENVFLEKIEYIEITPPQLYDANGWYLKYDIDTGTPFWIHNPDLTQVIWR